MIDPVKKLLAALRDGPCSPADLRIAVGIKHRQTFRANYLNPALRNGLICAKDGFSSHDPNICYAVTDLGLRVLNEPVNEPESEATKRSDVMINDVINKPDVVINEALNVLSSSERPIKRPIKDVVFEIIVKNQGISRLQIASIIGKGITVTTQALSSLRQAGKIEHRGSKKTGGYYKK